MNVRLLLIEDNPGDALLLQRSLEAAFPGRYGFTHAATLAEALRRSPARCFMPYSWTSGCRTRKACIPSTPSAPWRRPCPWLP